MRDRTHFSQSEVVEGSRVLKNPDKQDKDDLLNVCQSSASDFGSKFMRSVAGQQRALRPEPLVEDVPEAGKASGKGGGKKQRFANVADEAPKQYGKLQKDIPTCKKSIKASMDKLALSFETKKLAGWSEDSDPELKAYVRVATFRQALGKLGEAKDVAAATAAMSSAMSIVSSGEASPTLQRSTSSLTVTPEKAKTEANDGGDGERPLSEPGSGVKTKSVACGLSARSEGQQISDMLHKALKAAGNDGMVVQQQEDLLGVMHMEEVINSTMDAKTMAELEQKVAKFKKAFEQSKLLAGAINKSASNLHGHVQNLKKKKDRETAKQQKDAESKEIQQVKAKAKAAAKQVRDS